MDESPERDIDIVSGAVVTDTGLRKPVVNETTGQGQRVIMVDNSAQNGGDGSVERPFNTLADAQAALQANDVIYINSGNGTSAGMNQGITINKTGVRLIGSGADFNLGNGVILKSTGLSPVITNAGGDGILVTASKTTVSGISVIGAQRDGIVVSANGAGAVLEQVRIENVLTMDNRIGIYLHGLNGGSLNALVQNATAIVNRQHGIAVYDDTSGTFDVDMGGGAMSGKGQNIIAMNKLENLALDYDGRTLAAQNNWWGQSGGPSGRQIYYGAPINDGLVGHWTLDTAWIDGTTVYDRSGNNLTGTMVGGLSSANRVTGQKGQGLLMDGNNDYITIPGATLPHGNAPRTVIANFYTEASSWAADNNSIFYYGTVSTRQGFGLDLDPYPNLQPFTNGDNATYNPGAPQTGWLGVSMNYDGNLTSRLLSTYGAALNKVYAAQLNTGFANDLIIGSYTTGNVFAYNSIIDDVMVFNRAMSDAEVQEIFRASTSSTVNFGNSLSSSPR